MYIYKLGTECDGAQMRASVVYIPTLVALLGLCFDPSECFRDLCIWSRVMGNKSSKLWYISRIVTRLHNAEWSTTLDLCWGFNNVHLKEGDEWKAAFSTNQGLFEPLIRL